MANPALRTFGSTTIAATTKTSATGDPRLASWTFGSSAASQVDEFLDLLRSVLSQPTAPFRESWVMAALRIQCERRGLPLFEDSFGNLWLGAKSLNDVRKSRLVFVAHTDHPGFIIERFGVEGGHVFADGKWIGGGPTQIEGHCVHVFSHLHAGISFAGIVKSCSAGPRGADKGRIKLVASPEAAALANPKSFKSLGPWGACLWFDKSGLPFGVDVRGDAAATRMVTKAADDLVGVCALIDAYDKAARPAHRSRGRHKHKGTRSPSRVVPGVTCLFSRAEEGGFHGTVGVLESRWLDPRKTLMFSVETSSAVPGGAEIGKGPVVRLGDRASVFDPGFTKWVQDLATGLAGGTWGTVNEKTGFSYQRRVMDGGSCEASAFNAYEFQVAGMSVPLGGYHNIGPAGAAVPEEVCLSDARHGASLLAAIMTASRKLDARKLRASGFGRFRKDIVAGFRKHRKYF